MTEEQKILSSVVDTLTGKMLYKFTVPVKWLPNAPPKAKVPWWKCILRSEKPGPITEPETHRTFEIWPCVVANQYRIASKAVLLPTQIWDDPSLLLPMTNDILPIQVYIIAAAIQNNHLEPDPGLIEFIERNFDNNDIFQALIASLQNLNMQSFFNSTVLINQQITILKTDPIDGSELIASPMATS